MWVDVDGSSVGTARSVGLLAPVTADPPAVFAVGGGSVCVLVAVAGRGGLGWRGSAELDEPDVGGWASAASVGVADALVDGGWLGFGEFLGDE